MATGSRRPSPSTAQRMADGILRQQGTTLEDFIRERRDAAMSWEHIARELESETGGMVRVSLNTVKRWAEDAA